MKTQFFESIVGFVVICIAGWFIFSVVSKSENFLVANSIKYSASFNDVSGISVGSEVKLAGVTIGKVLRLKLDNDNYMVEMILGIDSEIIPNDSEIIITQSY